jgi:hypothetical protein
MIKSITWGPSTAYLATRVFMICSVITSIRLEDSNKGIVFCPGDTNL